MGDVPRLRAAIVGTGFIARVHRNALRDLGVEIAAVCGRTLERARSLGTGAPYDDLAALLRSERVDVLHVCTTNDLHAPQALAALERGVHVVCEKPLATSSGESARLLEEAERRGLVGAVAFHSRGFPLVEHVRAEVAAGALGELLFAHGRYVFDLALRDPGNWRRDPARSGPSFVAADVGIHWLDLLEHVTGLRAREALADFGAFAGGGAGEDYAAVLLRLDGGAAATAHFSAVSPGRSSDCVLELEGRRAGVTWRSVSPNELLFRPADAPAQVVAKDPARLAGRAREFARLAPGLAEGYEDAFRNIFRDAYLAAAGEAHGAFPTFADGHRSMRLLEALIASARRREWVSIET